MLKNVKDFNGIFSKDLISKNAKNGWYVINMQNSTDGNGTHWCALKITPHNILWYDSFGFIPPMEIIDLSKDKNILWSDKEIQDELSTACGYFSVACILYNEENKGSDIQKYREFLNKFSVNTLLNDKILYDMLYK
jgi:hypothetical protein